MDNEIINHLIKKFTSAPDLNTAASIALSEICRKYDLPYGECWLSNSTGDQLEIFTMWDNGSNDLSDFKKFTHICKFGKGVGLIGKCWEEGKPQWWENISSSKNFLRDDMAKKAGFNTGLALPSIMNENDVTIFSFFIFKSKKKDIAFINELWTLILKIHSIIKYNIPLLKKYS